MFIIQQENVEQAYYNFTTSQVSRYYPGTLNILYLLMLDIRRFIIILSTAIFKYQYQKKIV